MDRPNWRCDTIWQLDGAAYHTADLVKSVLAKLKVPTMISSPYLFDVAACELWFSSFKRGELNPTGKAVSKSKYFIHLKFL